MAKKRSRRPGRQRPAQAGARVARCGFPQRCRARELLRKLTIDELRLALDQAREPGRTNFYRAMGWSPSNKKVPALLRARLAMMDSQGLHSVMWVISAAPMAGLAALFGIERPEEEALPDDVNIAESLTSGVLVEWCTSWPAALVRVTLEAMWDDGYFSVEERDALMAMTKAPDALAVGSTAEEPDGPTTQEGVGPICGDAAIRRRVIATTEKAAPPTGSAPEAPAGSGNALSHDADSFEALVADAVGTVVATSPVGPEADRLRSGLEWMIALDPTRDAAWHTYGQLVAQLAPSTPTLTPAAGDTSLAFMLGQAASLARAGQHERLEALLRAHPMLAEQILEAPAGVEVVGAVLTARLEEPREVARLLGLTTGLFPGWRHFVRSARAKASNLIHGGGAVEAEIVLRALEEALWRWSGQPDRPTERGLEGEAAGVALLRAACRRSRSDFVGANRLLDQLDVDLLDEAGRVAASTEKAMAAAELTELEQVRFPKDGKERARLIERLDRAATHLDNVLELDPGQLEANLLLGLLAYCRDDDANAARRLGTALAGLAERPGAEDLMTAARFHWSLAQLRLLEPGTDHGAYLAIEGAMEGGYRPGVDELVSAAVALEAHGSPHASEFLRMVASVAPTDLPVGALVAERARAGDKDAGAAAEQLGVDRRLSLVSRFSLLDAALAGADKRRDPECAAHLAGELDEVLIRASQADLDEQWAETLANNETLRGALEPAHADALRIGVLRRVGRLDEARAIARALFYRAAAGDLRAFDAAELVELLRELGSEQSELDELGRLIRDPPVTDRSPQEPADPVRIIFVGGAEPQEQALPHVAASIAERYGGMVEVDWFIPGWSSNWPLVAERVEAAYDHAGAVVLMVLVRTNFGRWTRRTAGEHGLPWVSCTGHGRASMERAIDRAVALARDRARAGNRSRQLAEACETSSARKELTSCARDGGTPRPAPGGLVQASGQFPKVPREDRVCPVHEQSRPVVWAWQDAGVRRGRH